jgi:hypothetical protein
VLVQLSFETENGGTDTRINLMQMPGSPIAALIPAQDALRVPARIGQRRTR